MWPEAGVNTSPRYRKLTNDDTAAEATEFRRGQATVVELVRRARDEAYGRLELVGSTLSPQQAENVRQRLEEVDRRLARLQHHGGSSWLMTTS